MMTLLNKLKATCPHCQHRFFRFKVEKGIKFCPHCDLSLLEFKKIEKNISIRELALHSLTSFFFVYLLLSWSDYPALQYLFSNIPIYWYALMLLFIVLLAHSFNLFAKNHPTQVGVDSLDIVQKDIEGYDISLDYDDPNLLTQCPNCTSQRLQGLYWYKKNLINNKMDITRLNNAQKDIASEDFTFIGCLHCHHYFLNIANPDKQSLKEGGVKFLAVVIMMALWLCGAYIFSLDTTALSLISDIASLTTPVIYIIKAGLISLVLVLIIPLQKIMHRNPPPRITLKPLAIDSMDSLTNKMSVSEH